MQAMTGDVLGIEGKWPPKAATKAAVFGGKFTVNPRWGVKEHLHRVHKLRPHCLRCFEFFDSEKELREHHQSAAPCQPNKPLDDSFGYNEQKETMLSRKAPRGQTEEDKWKEIYTILFPDDKSTIPGPYRYFQRSPMHATFDNTQRYKYHLGQELVRMVKMVENLVLEEYGKVDESFRIKLRRLAQQVQTEAFASVATLNQDARHMTAAPRKATIPDKPLVAILPSTNANTNTKERKPPSLGMIQGLKRDVDIPALQKPGAYETTLSNVQEKNQSDLARNKGNNLHQATSKSMLQGSRKNVQNYNPFSNIPMSSSRSEQTIFPAQNMQFNNGAGLTLPDYFSHMSNLPPVYSTPTLRGTERTTAPSLTQSSIVSLNPFTAHQSYDHRNSGSFDSTQSLNQGNMNPPSYDKGGWA